MNKYFCDGCNVLLDEIIDRKYIRVDFSENSDCIDLRFDFCKICYPIFSKDLEIYLDSKFKKRAN